MKADEEVLLKEIYKGFPADKAGLKAADEVIQIGDINLKEYKEDADHPETVFFEVPIISASILFLSLDLSC